MLTLGVEDHNMEVLHDCNLSGDIIYWAPQDDIVGCNWLAVFP